MISRNIEEKILAGLDRQAAVILIGPRQSGKTTLAHKIAENKNGIYLDLESQNDRGKLINPSLYFEQNQDKLIVLDEIHKMPALFEEMRSIIDRARRSNKGKGRFLMLGSASLDLLKQSSETLAGRISIINMTPLNLMELDLKKESLENLWLRGGFPDSYLADSDKESYAIRKEFVKSYLERDVPLFGPAIPATTMERLWTLIAAQQGGTLNASELARMVDVSTQSINRYIDLLSDLFLVRRLSPYFINISKRLVKAPKIYVRDSGLLHVLVGIQTLSELISHQISGMSWEGFVIENILNALPWRAEAFYYRTQAGSEMDLVLKFISGEIWAIEIKRSITKVSLTKGFYQAHADLNPTKTFVIYQGLDRFPIEKGIEAVNIVDVLSLLKSLD